MAVGGEDHAASARGLLLAVKGYQSACGQHDPQEDEKKKQKPDGNAKPEPECERGHNGGAYGQPWYGLGRRHGAQRERGKKRREEKRGEKPVVTIVL
jgi:hypothetical protein